MKYWMHHDSPLGKLLLVASSAGLCGLYFEEHKYGPGPQGEEDSGHPLLREAARQLDGYFAGSLRQFELPLDLRGTDFQKQVWRDLQEVPYGERRTYTAQARRAGQENAVRATGSAIGRNPVCIIVPCHRIVGKDGRLAGYAGGLERKRFLLALEASG